MKIILVTLCVVAHVLATEVRQCANAVKAVEDLSSRIQVGSCKKPPCRLRKDHFIDVHMRFKPDRDIKSVTKTVNADILGIPFPFPSVDSTSACDEIYKEDGKTKASCNLKAGEEYQFKTRIEVLKIYPRLKTFVHWALTDDKGQDIICFEVPARITN